MADIKELETKRDALYAQLADLTEQITVLQTLYTDISICKDEINRLIQVSTDGEKRIEPKTIEAVTAEIQASKATKETIIIEDNKIEG